MSTASCCRRHALGGDRGAQPQGHHPFRWPASVYDPGAPLRPPELLAGQRSGAGHLLRHAGHGPSTRRHDGACGPARVWSGHAARRRRREDGVRRTSTQPPLRRPAVAHAGLDEPWRFADRRCPSGFSRAGPHGDHACRRAAATARERPAVPSRGRAYAPGHGIIDNFLKRVCGCDGTWTPGNVVAESIARIRARWATGA